MTDLVNIPDRCGGMDVELVVVPDDGLCEGCSGPIGDDPCETLDMVLLCRGCYDICIDETKELQKATGTALLVEFIP